VAVIVNEFGNVGIDHHLLLSSEQQVVQMNNGCICCSVRGDLVQNLFQLLQLRGQFDVVVIEMTGLADPGPVAQSLYADERIKREFGLQGVVAVVDAKHADGQLRETNEAAAQIAFADLILLNKTDLMSPDELDRIEGDLRRINSAAKTIRTRNSEVDLREIFDLDMGRAGGKSGFLCINETAFGGDDARHRADHLRGIETLSIVEPGQLDGLRLSGWFRELINEAGPRLMRMKGVLNIWGDSDRFFFQGVQMEFEGRPGPAWEPGEDRLNRLVFIGRNLDRTKVTRGFRACIATGDGPTTRNADPFGRDNLEISPLRLDQIRYWMRQNFGFPVDAPIVIKEVPCMKSSCPPIETAIMAILENQPPRMFKVQHTINEITFDHVYDLMENPMPCC
jgi:G3E family GTPase